VKIALVNPNTSMEFTLRMVAIAAREAGTRAEVTGHTARFGVPLITDTAALSVAAEAVAALAPALLEAHAAIVAAFSDPGLDALRGALPYPVTGIAEAGMAEAAKDGRRFAVVTTTPALIEAIAATAARHGHRRFAGTWTTPGDPVALTANAAALDEALATAIAAAIADGGAEAVVIGGGPLAEAARALASRTPVPLIEPVPAAVRLSLERLRMRATT
jgi:allantoin racemase